MQARQIMGSGWMKSYHEDESHGTEDEQERASICLLQDKTKLCIDMWDSDFDIACSRSFRPPAVWSTSGALTRSHEYFSDKKASRAKYA